MPALTLVCGLLLLLVVSSEVRGDNPRDYLEIQSGAIPIIITAPHGGGMIPSDVSSRVCDGSNDVCSNDQNTHLLAVAVCDQLELLLGARPYQVVNRVDRLYIDMNRSNADNPYGSNDAYDDADARPYYEFYHGAISESVSRVLDDFGRGILIDIHGQSKYPNTVIRGTRNGQTVTHLLETYGEQALTGTNSVFGQLELAGYPVTPPNEPLADEPETVYNGGHTVATYGSHRTSGIDSLQIEFAREYRVTTADPDIWQQTALDLADAIKVFYDNYLVDPPLPGDYNDDGLVDLADYTVWRNNLGSANSLPNDSIGGIIGASQYEIWKNNVGSSAAASFGGTTAVPEPPAFAMLLLGIALLYRTRSLHR